MVIPYDTPSCPWTGCPSILPFRSALRIHPEVNQLFLINGCNIPTLGVSVSTCKLFYNGMLANGVAGVFQQLMVVVQQLVTERIAFGLSLGSNSTLLAQCKPTNLVTSSDPRIFLIQQFVEVYMGPAFSHNSLIYKTYVDSTVEEFLSLDNVITAMSISALFIVYFVLYRPYLNRLNIETKAVRSLLLLFPDNLSSNLGSLKDLLHSAGRVTFSADALKK